MLKISENLVIIKSIIIPKEYPLKTTHKFVLVISKTNSYKTYMIKSDKAEGNLYQEF